MTAAPRLRLRVFVSSPGDVAAERAGALDLLNRLPELLGVADRLQVEPVLWDDPLAPVPMELGRGGQASVDAYKVKPSQCDLVIVILATRFGSAARMEDGSVIESGTAYEIDDALAARVPVWVYRRRQALSLAPGDPPDVQQRQLAQFQRVQQFFDTRFTDSAGLRTGEFTAYADAPAFVAQLHHHLKVYTAQQLELHAKPYGVPEPDGGPPLTGREKALARLEALVLAGRHACLVQTPGVGKTALALALVGNRPQMLRSFAGVLWMEFGQRPELQPQLRQWAWALGIEEDIHATLATEDDWKRAIQARIGTRRMLIVLDDVWYPDQANDVMRRLPQCVFVVTTRRAQEVACELDAVAADQCVTLDDLTEDESLLLLTRIAPDAVRLLPGRVRQLVQRVGGLPQALKLIGKYLHKKSVRGSKDVLDRALDELHRPEVLMELSAPTPDAQASSTRTLDALVDLSFRALESDDQRRAFVALAVFRPKPYYFTADMAGEICSLADPVGDFEALLDLGLVECRYSDDTTRDSEYTLHPIVHGFAQRRLDPARRTALQNRLLDWYGRRIDVTRQDGVADQYALWYRYEHDDWHADVGNWLYYLAVGGDATASMAAFLRVYFDAWWWWGFFQEFRFCGRLIEEWSLRSVGPQQRAGLALLQEFQDAYPRGMGPRGKRSDWRRAQAALQKIRAGLDGDPLIDGKRPEDVARTRASIDFALAECAAYGDGDRARGLALLGAAHAALAALQDTWSCAYLSGYQAQFHIETGALEAGFAAIERGMAEADGIGAPDPELYAHLWRARADALLRQGDVAQASQAWCRAAALALAFQALPETADPYTVSYFEYQADCFCNLVLSRSETDARGARTLARDMQDLWQPWWQRHAQGAVVGVDGPIAARDAGALRLAVFPPMVAPEPHENLVRLAAQVDAVMDAVLDLAGLAPLARRLRDSHARSSGE